jgi:hypothetical protein
MWKQKNIVKSKYKKTQNIWVYVYEKYDIVCFLVHLSLFLTLSNRFPYLLPLLFINLSANDISAIELCRYRYLLLRQLALTCALSKYRFAKKNHIDCDLDEIGLKVVGGH